MLVQLVQLIQEPHYPSTQECVFSKNCLCISKRSRSNLFSTFDQFRLHFDGRFTQGFITVCIGLVTMDNSFRCRPHSTTEFTVLSPSFSTLDFVRAALHTSPEARRAWTFASARSETSDSKFVENHAEHAAKSEKELSVAIIPCQARTDASVILYKDLSTGWISLVATCARLSDSLGLFRV